MSGNGRKWIKRLPGGRQTCEHNRNESNLVSNNNLALDRFIRDLQAYFVENPGKKVFIVYENPKHSPVEINLTNYALLIQKDVQEEWYENFYERRVHKTGAVCRFYNYGTTWWLEQDCSDEVPLTQEDAIQAAQKTEIAKLTESNALKEKTHAEKLERDAVITVQEACAIFKAAQEKLKDAQSQQGKTQAEAHKASITHSTAQHATRNARQEQTKIEEALAAQAAPAAPAAPARPRTRRLPAIPAAPANFL